MHIRAPQRNRPRAGFTLVELLTVILIIGMLTALISSAAIMAKKAANRAVDKTDISQLAMAIEKYKIEYGDYPPDFAFINHGDMTNPNDPIRLQARNDLMRHIRKRWPRYGGSPLNLIASLANYGLAQAPASATDDPMTLRIYLDPASALAFWLGGLPEEATALKPSGFHQDPTNPFQTGGPRAEPLFEFDERRFVWRENDPFTAGVVRGMRYYPASATVPEGNPATVNEYAPYVYFKSRRLALAENRYEYGYVDDPDPTVGTAVVISSYVHGPAGPAATTLLNVAVPYLDAFPGAAPYWDADVDDPTDTTIVPAPSPTDVSSSTGLTSLHYVRRWRNLEKFQVLCAGLDGQYGDITLPQHAFRFTRTGQNFTQQDPDNMGDFSEGALEDELE